MRVIVLVLLSCVLGCMSGCIPIGVRGSSLAGAQAPPCGGRPQVDTGSRPTPDAAGGDRSAAASPHCA